MEDRIGNFEIDKEFDALLIDVSAPGSAIDIFSKVRNKWFLKSYVMLVSFFHLFLQS